MNLKELIEKYEDIANDRLSAIRAADCSQHELDIHVNVRGIVSLVIDDLKQLELANVEYKQKVKIPQFIVEWLKYCENRGYSLCGAMTTTNEMSNEMKLWLVESSNQLTFVKAYEYGYEVEEEPMYEVVLFDNKTDRLLLMELNEHDCQIDWECNNDGYRTQWFTEKQIKDMDGRYWPFAVPVEQADSVYVI